MDMRAVRATDCHIFNDEITTQSFDSGGNVIDTSFYWCTTLIRMSFLDLRELLWHRWHPLIVNTAP